MYQKIVSVVFLLACQYAVGDAKLVSYDQFSNAVTWHGYPAPSWDQYTAFVDSAGPKGSIWDKQEGAMALAHFIQESGGLVHKREHDCKHNGCPGVYVTHGCDVPGEYYYGRGYIQLSYCYNYRAASFDLFGDDRLVRDPDSVARSERLSWDTAFWFWKKNVHYRNGVAQGKFGVTTNAINGEKECRGAYQDKARTRFKIYKMARKAFGLNPNDAIEQGCYN